MATWLFDLGNTRLKGARLAGDGSLIEQFAVTHSDGGDWLTQLPQGEIACIASVAPTSRRVALMDALAGRFVRQHRVHTELALGALRIAYPRPGNLGVDRFLAMLGIAGTGASLMVGVGTALTIDLLDAEGAHVGGRIAPSPELMRQALHARAAQLPVDGGRYAEFADDTNHALASGCEGAAVALVQRSLIEATRVVGSEPVVHLHGGGAIPLRERMPQHTWAPDAVLQGLARWFALRIE